VLNDVIYFKQTTYRGSSVASDGTRAHCDSRRVDQEASSVLMDDMPLKKRKEMDGKMMKKKKKKK
jgi:hypothetical protein